jgi:hypothetical protein
MMYGVRGDAIIPNSGSSSSRTLASLCRRVEALPELEPRRWEDREDGRILELSLGLGDTPKSLRLNHFDRRLLQLKLR